jgi:hypothetical protein
MFEGSAFSRPITLEAAPASSERYRAGRAQQAQGGEISIKNQNCVWQGLARTNQAKFTLPPPGR